MKGLFAVLFFLMMVVLGFGSAVALLSTINTVMMDSFPKVPVIVVSATCCTGGFLIGLVYVTPGGQYILELVDHYGATFLVLFSAIAEIIGIFWIYGLENVCLDIEYMLGRGKTSVFWRWCWGLITPLMMIVVFMYSLTDLNDLTFGEDYVYPTAAYVAGYVMLFSGMALVPIFIAIKICKSWTGNFTEVNIPYEKFTEVPINAKELYRWINQSLAVPQTGPVMLPPNNAMETPISFIQATAATWKTSFHKNQSWGPRAAEDRRGWIAFKQEAEAQREKAGKSWLGHIWASLNGSYRKRR